MLEVFLTFFYNEIFHNSLFWEYRLMFVHFKINIVLFPYILNCLRVTFLINKRNKNFKHLLFILPLQLWVLRTAFRNM